PRGHRAAFARRVDRALQIVEPRDQVEQDRLFRHAPRILDLPTRASSIGLELRLGPQPTILVIDRGLSLGNSGGAVGAFRQARLPRLRALGLRLGSLAV